MRALARRVTRLEEVIGPRPRLVTLQDLVLASMGQGPLPEDGRVAWAPGLREAFEELESRRKKRREVR